MALNRISSTIRNVNNLNLVIQDVIDNIAGGFGYVSCLLLHVDETARQLRYFVPRDEYAEEIFNRWGIDFNNIYLPLEDQQNFVYEEMRENSIIDLREDYTYGVQISVKDEAKINDIKKTCKELVDITKEIIFK